MHHVVLRIDPRKDLLWKSLRNQIHTDGVHANENIILPQYNKEMLSEAVKLLKGN